MWQEGRGTRQAPVACVTLCPWPGPGSTAGALCVAGRGQPGLESQALPRSGCQRALKSRAEALCGVG